MAFGERLQREREMRGITLEEISKATRIGTRSLRALEQEDFGKLPGGIFNKGFVRAYARYLGIDEEQAVIDYIAAIGEPEDPALDSEHLKKLEANWKPPRRNRLSIDPYFRMPWRGLGLLVVIVALLALFWVTRHGAEEPVNWLRAHRIWPIRAAAAAPAPMPAPQPAAAPADSLHSEPVAAPSSFSAPAAPVPPAPEPAPPAARESAPAKADSRRTAPASGGGEFSLRVRARKQSWVTIEADGQTKVSRMLEAGQERSIPASSRIRLVLGDPTAVDVFWNERKQPRLGSASDARVLYFTPRGMESSD